jgi:hypothetical protein
MHKMDFIIKVSSNGTFGCLTSTKFPRKNIIHPFLGKKIKVCEVMALDVIMIDTKLTTTLNVINPMDKRNSHLFWQSVISLNSFHLYLLYFDFCHNLSESSPIFLFPHCTLVVHSCLVMMQ